MLKKLCVAAFALLLMCSAGLRADDEEANRESEKGAKKENKAKSEKKEKEPVRIYPRGPEIERLKSDAGLSDEQIAKAREAVTAVTRKHEQLRGGDAVARAEEELKKAREAVRAAEDKLKAAKEGFELNDEYKKAVYTSVPDDKKQKVAEVLKLKIKAEKPASEDKN